MESWHIRQNRQSINKDRGVLPDVHNSLTSLFVLSIRCSHEGS